MEYINENEGLLKYLTGERSLISATINRIDIHLEQEQLCIDVFIELLYSPEKKKIKLEFIDILEYSFLYNSTYSFYNIENYKFFSSENGFYICFDPFNENKEMSTSDQDYIQCKSVKGYLCE